MLLYGQFYDNQFGFVELVFCVHNDHLGYYVGLLEAVDLKSTVDIMFNARKRSEQCSLTFNNVTCQLVSLYSFQVSDKLRHVMTYSFVRQKEVLGLMKCMTGSFFE